LASWPSSVRAAPRCRLSEFVAPRVATASQGQRPQHFFRISTRWWSRRPGATRSRRFGGHAEHEEARRGIGETWAQGESAAVAVLLKEQGYSLQANRKTREGSSQHPDRMPQFEHINSQAKRFAKRGQPVISVDNQEEGIGRRLHRWPAGSGGRKAARDSADARLSRPARGKAIPYGVYDVNATRCWVNCRHRPRHPDSRSKRSELVETHGARRYRMQPN